MEFRHPVLLKNKKNKTNKNQNIAISFCITAISFSNYIPEAVN